MTDGTINKQPPPKDDTDTKNAMIIQTCLEEHRALRNEIEQNNVSMRYIFIFNMTASGTIYSFVLSNIDSLKDLLLIIPILSSILGIIFFSHSLKISLLGHYIRDKISPKIKLLTNDSSVLDWEYYIRQEDRRQRLFKWFSLDLVWLSVFLLISGISLVSALVSGLCVSVIWIIGLVLTIAVSIMMVIDRYYFWSR